MKYRITGVVSTEFVIEVEADNVQEALSKCQPDVPQHGELQDISSVEVGDISEKEYYWVSGRCEACNKFLLDDEYEIDDDGRCFCDECCDFDTDEEQEFGFEEE